MQLVNDAWQAFIGEPLYADTDSPWRASSARALPASSKRILPHMDVCCCPMRS